MHAKTTRPDLTPGIGPFQFARAGFDRRGCSLLCTSAREAIEPFLRRRANVDVDGRTIIEIREERALARVLLAPFFGTAGDQE